MGNSIKIGGGELMKTINLKNITDKWAHLRDDLFKWYHFKTGEIKKVPEDIKFDKTQFILTQEEPVEDKQKEEETGETKEEILEKEPKPEKTVKTLRKKKSKKK